MNPLDEDLIEEVKDKAQVLALCRTKTIITFWVVQLMIVLLMYEILKYFGVL